MQDHRTLTSRYLWLASTILLFSALLFFLGGPDYESPRSLNAFWDLGHIGYFGLFTLLITCWRFISRQPPLMRWGIVLATTLVLGISIEVLQYGTQRDADPWDVVRDVSGSFLVLAFSRAYTSQLASRWRNLLKAVAVVSLLGLLTPFTISLSDETIARQQFPVLSDFETPFETGRWTGDARIDTTTLPMVSRNKLLQISLTTQQYSGTALKYFPTDWRNYQYLKMRFYQPQPTPLKIVCRIHDLQHTYGKQELEDRFNQAFTLNQGWNEIDIDLKQVASAPKGRRMDMSQINGLGIFTIYLPQPQFLYLDKVYLSN